MEINGYHNLLSGPTPLTGCSYLLGKQITAPCLGRASLHSICQPKSRTMWGLGSMSSWIVTS
jgi:hypothetical protein